MADRDGDDRVQRGGDDQRVSQTQPRHDDKTRGQDADHGAEVARGLNARRGPARKIVGENNPADQWIGQPHQDRRAEEHPRNNRRNHA